MRAEKIDRITPVLHNTSQLPTQTDQSQAGFRPACLSILEELFQKSSENPVPVPSFQLLYCITICSFREIV